MKYHVDGSLFGDSLSRSREGAWIEIATLLEDAEGEECRSREGAWIEIIKEAFYYESEKSRSREGAWIEIPSMVGLLV